MWLVAGPGHGGKAPAGDRQRAEQAATAGSGLAGAGRRAGDVKVITRLQFRMDGVGFLGDRRMHLLLVDADGTAPVRQVTSGDFDHNTPAWSADGQALYCTVCRDPQVEQPGSQDIWRLDLESGAAGPVADRWGSHRAGRSASASCKEELHGRN